MIQSDIELKTHNSFNLHCKAKLGEIIFHKYELEWVREYIIKNKLSYAVVSMGTNILLPPQFNGFVIIMLTKDILVVDNKLFVAAGGSLDNIVRTALFNNLYGIENLSFIPGSIGGGIVQNAGAYGVELSDVIESVEVFDMSDGKYKKLTNKECEFKYRDSIFKRKNNYIITGATLQLQKKWVPHTSYFNMDKKDIPKNAHDMREFIITTRMKKFGNKKSVGSFFKNPIVSKEVVQKLKNKFTHLKTMKVDNKEKIILAFLMDKCLSLSGYTSHNVSLSKNNPIVVEAKEGVTRKEIDMFVEDVKNKIKKETGLDIENEVISLTPSSIHA